MADNPLRINWTSKQFREKRRSAWSAGYVHDGLDNPEIAEAVRQLADEVDPGTNGPDLP